MTRFKLQYVHEFMDRHGKVRRYFRRPGFKQAPLPGLPGSAEFMAAYQQALDGVTAPRIEIGASRSRPGTVAALVAAYFAAARFKALAPSTQSTYRGIIERFRQEHGDKRVALLQREHIAKMLGRKAATPAAANNWLRMVRMLMQFAVEEGVRGSDPTAGVKGVRQRSEGFYTWSETDIATFEAKHPVGTRARLALALLLYTAQRRSDVVRIGRPHVRDGVLAIRQQKTGTLVEIPMHPELVRVLEATPLEHPQCLTFLATQYGQPFTPPGFTNWFRERCAEANLPKACCPHGLRKAASRRLAEAGCTAHQIMSITGHRTLKEVTRYTEAADRKRLAQSAMATITGTGSGKP
jgi:integrase